MDKQVQVVGASARGRSAVRSALMLAVMVAAPVIAMAQGTDPTEAAFGQIENKITAVLGFALGLAVVGAVGWSGIALFQKGVRRGGGKT